MIKIALMGLGVVGGGVVDVLRENSDSIAKNAADEISVKYILTRRPVPESPVAELMVQNFEIIEKDPEVSIVVETIGGVGPAYEYTKRALLAGKSVVTANKELVAAKGHELMEIAKARNVNYLFEASVGGGIPIIRPITQCLAANRIDEVYGIVNGTTNYILTQMIRCGTSFADALKQAQENGYAEADPTADIEGHDACRKICILSDLCFGRHVEPEKVPTEGITGVSLHDVECARAIGYKIKLLGRAFRLENDRVAAYVAPHLISTSSLLSNVDGVMNGIVVHGNAIGEAMFYGPGAGKRPTASAVVADVIDAAKHLETRKHLEWQPAREGYVADADEIPCRWYVRARAEVADINRGFGRVSFIGTHNTGEGECAFVTEAMPGKMAKQLKETLQIRSMFRVLD